MNFANPAKNKSHTSNNFSLSYFLLASAAIHILILINWVKPEIISKPTQVIMALKIKNYLPPVNKTKAKEKPVAPVVKKVKKIQKKIVPIKTPVKKVAPVKAAAKKVIPVETQEMITTPLKV